MKIKPLFSFALFIACFMGVLSAQTQVAPFLNSRIQLFNVGAPCSGCLLDTFAASTTTPLATYSESTGTTPNANPVVLASDGSAVVYLTNAAYKLRLRTAAGATLWTQDQITWNKLATTLSSLTLTGNATINSSTAATNVANQSGPTFCMDGNFWNGSASAVDSWCWNDVLGTGTNPTSTLTLVHSGSSGTPVFSVPALSASSATISGATNLSGTSTISRIQKDCRVDGVTYTTIGAAYADSTNCKSVRVPSGYTETLAANLVLSRSAVPIIFEGTAAITMGTFQITAAGTVNSVAIVAPFCFMSNGGASCVDFTYTGTAQAIVIGDSSTHSKDFYMRGINVNISGNGASCLKINNLDEFEVSAIKCSITAGTSPIAIITNGTGTFVGVGKFDNVQILSGGGTNAIGYQFQNITTHTQIIGGNLNLDVGASAVCFDVQGASTGSIELMNPNANTCNTAVQVESSATTTSAIVGDFRVDSGVSVAASFATGTVGNQLRCINCVSGGQTVSDSGTNNSVEVPTNNQINGKLWRTKQASSDYELVNLLTAKDRFAATTVNSFVDTESTGSLLINSLSGGTGGVQFCHGDNTHCLIMNPSPSANRTWATQDASGTVPLIIASGTSTFTTTLVTAGTCQTTVTTAATNALTSDTITTAYTTAPVAATDGVLTLQAYLTAGNVNFMRCNPTAASVTPTALVLNWRVIR